MRRRGKSRTRPKHNHIQRAEQGSRANAAWARAEVRFLRAFGARPPINVDAGAAGKLHTIPFRVLNEKIIVKARVNKGPQMDFVLDTGSEQTVISRETAARMGIRPIVNILSAGVGDLGVRELELTRLDELEIGGSLKVQNVLRSSEPPLQASRPRMEASRRWHGHVGDHRLRPPAADHGRRAARRDR